MNTILSRLATPSMPDGMSARLKMISQKPQTKGLWASLWVFEDLSFGLRHDLRYQLAAACAAVVLSLGAWQGLSLRHEQPTNLMSAEPEVVASLMEADPVLAGAL